MNRELKKVLNMIEQNGFEAYIVGGYVRDYLLGRKSNDIDICTNAKPKEINKIFKSLKANGIYGTYTLKTKQYNYDITTYREEMDYQGRKPSKIEYTDNLLLDLKRRDFTINSLCMNKEGKILDFLDGRKDLDHKIIRTIGNPKIKITEDPLRILRAIRFSSTLNLEIEENLWKTINEQRKLILTLSKNRIKKELDAILLSINFQKGLDMLEELGILSLLKIKRKKIFYVNDLCGMWAQLECTDDFPFQKNEKKRIKEIKDLLKDFSLNKQMILKHGLEIILIVSKIKGYSENMVLKMHHKMKVHDRSELNISFEEIKNILKRNAKETRLVEEKMMNLILEEKLKNKKKDMIKYLKEVEK